MDNVSVHDTPVNEPAGEGETPQDLGPNSLEAVLAWAEKMAERGLYSHNNARLYQTALRKVTSILADDESKEPAAVLAQVEAIADRYGIRENAKPDTVRAYRRRTEIVLGDYLKYMESPTTFKGRSRSASSKPKAERTKPKAQGNSASEPPTALAPSFDESRRPAPSSPGSLKLRSFPLGDGVELHYQIDGEGKWTVEKAMKAAIHLLLTCDDVTQEHLSRVVGVRTGE